MAWVFLAATIAAEVFGTFATRASQGFTVLLPTVGAVVGVVAAYYLLSLALRRGMSVGVAYGLWTALGVASVAVIGVVFLGEAFTALRAGGLLLVMVGVAVLQMGTPAPEPAGAAGATGATGTAGEVEGD